MSTWTLEDAQKKAAERTSSVYFLDAEHELLYMFNCKKPGRGETERKDVLVSMKDVSKEDYDALLGYGVNNGKLRKEYDSLSSETPFNLAEYLEREVVRESKLMKLARENGFTGDDAEEAFLFVSELLASR